MSTAKKAKPQPEKAAPAAAAVAVTESTELVMVENLTPAQIFTTESITKFINDVEKLKNDFMGEDGAALAERMKTAKGRAEIVSFAARIRKTRKLIDEEIGQTYVAVLKAEPGRIDKLRKTFRDTLDPWAVEVRAPVTALEVAEEARKKAHEDIIDTIGRQTTFGVARPTSAQIQERIDLVASHKMREWEEYQEQFDQVAGEVNESLAHALVAAKKAEDEAAELLKLKQEKAARDEKDRIDAAAETARLAGIEEGKRIAAASAAPPPQVAAITPDEPPLLRPASQAPTSATIGYGAGKAPRSAADEKKASVNREVLADLLAYGTTEAGAKNLIKAIATGTIRHVFIKYE